MGSVCKLVSALTLALAAVGCAGALSSEAGPAELARLVPPGKGAGLNVLLVTVDTLRADHLGCYGDADAETPAIDALARTGVLFRHAIAGAPITLPSHATLMTGLSAPSHGVRHNGTFSLAADKTTLAEVLQGAGYRTAAFIGAYVLDSRYGLAQGFEVYDDDVNPRGEPVPDAGFNHREANYVTDAALAWFGANARGPAPFFAWLHYFDPHAPYTPPQSFAERFAARPYDGEIAFTDSQLARVLGFLADEGLTERTLVILTADHGEGLGEHGEATHTLLIYDATVRVPLIFSCPRLFPESVTFGAGAVSTADVYPTVLGLLGIELGGPVDGRNVFADPPDERRAVYVESMAPLYDHGWSPLVGLRRAGAKLIRAPEMEFYRLSEDPGEIDNLYAQGGDEAAELDRELESWLLGRTSPEESWARRAPLDAEQRARLEALGYVGSGSEPAPTTMADPKAMMPFWNRIESADARCSAGQHQQAIAEIEAVLAEQPSSAKAWYTATRIYNRAGARDRALAAVTRAVELHPRSDGYVTLAQLSLLAGDPAAFERALAEATTLDPEDGGIHIARGDRLALEGRFAEALLDFERALEVDPHRSGPLAREKIAAARRRLGR